MTEPWPSGPDRAAAGAGVGLVASWMLGGTLFLGIAGPSAPGLEPELSTVEAFVIMLTIPAMLAVSSWLVERLRRWYGYFVPGVAAGWGMGVATLALLGVLGYIAT